MTLLDEILSGLNYPDDEKKLVRLGAIVTGMFLIKDEIKFRQKKIHESDDDEYSLFDLF